MRPRMLDICDPAFLFGLCDLACWIHATPHSDVVKKSIGKTHTPRKHRSMAGHTPTSTSPTPIVYTTSHPDLISSFHFILFSLKKICIREQNSNIDQTEKLEGFDS